MPLSFRLINVSVGDVGAPLSLFSAVLPLITCPSTGPSSLPYSQLCWHFQGKEKPAWSSSQLPVQSCKETEQHMLPEASAAEGKRKIQHTQPLQQAQCWTELGRFVSVHSAHPWCPQAPALTPVWHWGSSASRKALKELPHNSNLCPRALERQHSSVNSISPNTMTAFCRFTEERADFIHKHQTQAH